MGESGGYSIKRVRNINTVGLGRRPMLFRDGTADIKSEVVDSNNWTS